MSYKLICIDMDGTLLSDEKRISEINIDAIKKAYQKGVKIAVCTGRIFTSADYFGNLLNVKAPIIASNGAYIIEKDRNEVVYKGLLGYENSLKTLKILKKYNIYPHFYTTNTIFTEKIVYSSYFYTIVNNSLPKGKKVKIKVVDNWEEVFKKYENEILKGIGIDDDVERVMKAKEELCKSKDVEVVSSSYNNFEVMRQGVSKGKAVQILSSYYSISKDEIICIGDSENDLSMIEYAGLGIAMGNASDEIKNVADFVTDNNNENGVAKVIEKFVL